MIKKRSVSLETSITIRKAITKAIDSLKQDVSELETEHQKETFLHYEIMGNKLYLVSEQIKQLNKLLIWEGHLNGMTNKKLAEIFQYSPARICQILKEVKGPS